MSNDDETLIVLHLEINDKKLRRVLRIVPFGQWEAFLADVIEVAKRFADELYAVQDKHGKKVKGLLSEDIVHLRMPEDDNANR